MKRWAMMAAAVLLAAGPGRYAPAQEITLGNFPTVQKMLNQINTSNQPRAFVYVDHYEVRKELLVPLATLEQWVPIERADPAFISRQERLEASKLIASALAPRNPLRVDGVAVKPATFSLVFFDLQNLDRETPDLVRAKDAVVGVIFGYQPKGTPASVDMEWQLFSESIDVIELTVYPFDGAAEHRTLIPEAPTFTWQNPGRPPLAPIEAIAAPEPAKGLFSSGWKADAEQTGQALEGLLRNVYRAFDFKAESDIYDALAHSIDGPLLTEVYLQIRRGLVYQAEGGAISRVDSVTLAPGKLKDSGTADGNPWFEYEAPWVVAGMVEHWGHRHARVNRYDARFRIDARDGQWRITGFEVLAQERVSEAFSQRDDRGVGAAEGGSQP